MKHVLAIAMLIALSCGASAQETVEAMRLDLDTALTLKRDYREIPHMIHLVPENRDGFSMRVISSPNGWKHDCPSLNEQAQRIFMERLARLDDPAIYRHRLSQAAVNIVGNFELLTGVRNMEEGDVSAHRYISRQALDGWKLWLNRNKERLCFCQRFNVLYVRELPTAEPTGEVEPPNLFSWKEFKRNSISVCGPGVYTPCRVMAFETVNDKGFYYFQYDGALHTYFPTMITPVRGYPEMLCSIMDTSDMELVDFPLPRDMEPADFDTLLFFFFTNCNHLGCDVELIATDSVMELNCIWPISIEGHYRFALSEAERCLMHLVGASVKKGDIVLPNPGQYELHYTSSYLIVDGMRQWIFYPQEGVPAEADANQQILNAIILNHLGPENRLGPIDEAITHRLEAAGIPMPAPPPPPPPSEED